MKTLEQIKSNPKTNRWGSLGSRNRCPIGVNVNFELGTIWCVDGKHAIYKTEKGFNESIEIENLSDNILAEINIQIQ